MIDTVIWQRIAEVLSLAQHTRRPQAELKDEYGDIHLILFGDFKPPRRIRNYFVHPCVALVL